MWSVCGLFKIVSYGVKRLRLPAMIINPEEVVGCVHGCGWGGGDVWVCTCVDTQHWLHWFFELQHLERKTSVLCTKK